MVTYSQEEYLGRLLQLLQANKIFTDFPEIGEFVNRAEFGFFEQGTRVINQGEAGDSFYVVLEGQLRAIDMDYDPPRLLNYLSPGEIFGARALLENDPRAATIEVVTDAHLAFFSKSDWDWLIHNDDRIETYFRNLERQLERQAKFDFPGRQWDEVVVIAAKRHVLELLARLVWPLVLLIFPILFLILIEILGFTFLSFITDNGWLTLLVIGPFILLSILLAVYDYLDWRNDDYIVTTKRVVHIERVLLYGEKRDEAPLVRIQDVEVVSYTLLERFFDYHDVEVKTAGAGTIEINGIPKAEEIREAIFLERRRMIERVSAADLSAVRQMIAQHLDWEEALEQPVLAFAEAEATITTEVRDRHLPKFLDYFWPRVKVTLHEEGGTVILWHKHYLVLLWTTLLPMFCTTLSAYFFLASFFGFFPFSEPTGWVVWAILGGLTGFCLSWLAAKYDGWQRDRYLVTDRRIIDIEGTPFRLGGERRREGNFDNIQNITYDIPTFFWQLINMGNVVIETAGTEATFTFDMVYDPSAVQEEIFNRMVLYQQKQRERERDNTTAQLVEVIGQYHRLLEKTGTLPKRQ
jgi:uncharacterized membrane protein YdbT with pleckstrin-like domain